MLPIFTAPQILTAPRPHSVLQTELSSALALYALGGFRQVRWGSPAAGEQFIDPRFHHRWHGDTGSTRLSCPTHPGLPRAARFPRQWNTQLGKLGRSGGVDWISICRVWPSRLVDSQRRLRRTPSPGLDSLGRRTHALFARPRRGRLACVTPRFPHLTLHIYTTAAGLGVV